MANSVSYMVAAVLLVASSAAAQPIIIRRPWPRVVPRVQEVQPKNASGEPIAGGRSVAVSVSPFSDLIALVATFSGGLFRTADGGETWSHVPGLPANRLWEVLFDPADGNHVMATVVVDTHMPTHSGIWRSTDGGTTWSRPPGANVSECGNPPTPGYGRGISFGPGPYVFVGTDCGLAISSDRGVTWTRVVPSASDATVWDVASRPGLQYAGVPTSVIVDICSTSGPRRSTDAGATFGPLPTGAFPTGVCSVAHSPFEAGVLFAASRAPGGTGLLWESDDGGASWTQLWAHHNPGRWPFVQTRLATDGHATHFDLYFHAGADLFRQHCRSSSTGRRCPVAAETGAQCADSDDDDGDDMVNEGCPAVGVAESTLSGFMGPPCKNAHDEDGDGNANDGCDLIEYVGGFHDDGGMAFRSNDCPFFIASDMGVWRSLDCGLTWQAKNRGLSALQIYDLAGTVHPSHTDLYFGTQDTGVWASPDGGATWPAYVPAEGLWLQAPHHASPHGSALVTGMRCLTCTRFYGRDHFATGTPPWPPATDVNAPLSGNEPPFIIPGASGPSRFAQVSQGHLWIRDGAGTWTKKQPALPSLETAELFVAGPDTGPTIYVVTKRPPNARGLSRITGIDAPTLTIAPADTGLGDVYYWAPDDNPFKYPYVVGVAPGGWYVIAGDHTRDQMRVSTDGGATWRTDTALTALVTDGGRLLFHAPYLGLQAHVIRFNPAAGWHILVGTEASGVIESCNGGTTWHRIPGSQSITAVTDFVFDEVRRRVFVASYGRGLWTIDYPASEEYCWKPPVITVQTPPRLAVTVSVAPPVDPVQVSVSLDGAAWLPAAGHGVSSGWRGVSPGPHVVHAALLPPASAALYSVTIGGACGGGGSVTIANGQQLTCTITVARRTP